MVTTRQVDYICKQMMGLNWTPSLNEAALFVLESCESKLEIMYLLGVGYHLYRYQRSIYNESYPYVYTSQLKNGQYGLWFLEPWFGFCPYCGNGPSALMLVPQYQSPEKPIRHDFGLFTANDNGANDGWNLECAIEIDGYGIHKNRRYADKQRSLGLSYPVHHIFEETDPPHDWFKEIINCPCQGERSSGSCT